MHSSLPTGKAMHSIARDDDLRDMPEQYFQQTHAEEQARYQERVRQLYAGGGPFFDAVESPQGGWNIEIVTLDWEEPGLLDRIFEAILRCIHIPNGIQVKRARIFTGARGQVVNLLELQDRQGRPLGKESSDQV